MTASGVRGEGDGGVRVKVRVSVCEAEVEGVTSMVRISVNLIP